MKRKTKKQQLLEWLMSGKVISTWIAYMEFNMTCLPQRIYDFINEGIPIHSKFVTDSEGKQYMDRCDCIMSI